MIILWWFKQTVYEILKAKCNELILKKILNINIDEDWLFSFEIYVSEVPYPILTQFPNSWGFLAYF